MVERGNRPATADELAIAREEERLVAALREAVGEAERRERVRAGQIQELRGLRDEYAEAGEDDRPAILAQMHQQASREQATGKSGSHLGLVEARQHVDRLQVEA